jgi:antitoxin HicB
MKTQAYPFELRPLSKDDGGGWLITFPDLPGCMADGETIEEAISEGQDALKSWLFAAKKHGDPIPKPGSAGEASGQFRLRAPKSLHARLAARARQEGVSMNTLAVALLAEGLGKRS